MLKVAEKSILHIHHVLVKAEEGPWKMAGKPLKLEKKWAIEVRDNAILGYTILPLVNYYNLVREHACRMQIFTNALAATFSRARPVSGKCIYIFVSSHVDLLWWYHISRKSEISCCCWQVTMCMCEKGET